MKALSQLVRAQLAPQVPQVKQLQTENDKRRQLLKKANRTKPKPRFMCFGASGEICIRTCLGISYETQNLCVKIQGAPEVQNSKGRNTNWVKTPPGTVVISLYLSDTEHGCAGYWELDEVVPVNEPAIRLAAELKWQRLKSEFKNQRKEYHLRRPTLKENLRAIKTIVLK